MPRFLPGLFDRLDIDDEGAARAAPAHIRHRDDCKDSISRDLEALLNTRSALLPSVLAPYPAVGGSVVNYGLIDFAAMCMTNDTDQKRLCTAVRLAIERHEPRLHKVAVTLQAKKGAINRVDFVIKAQLKRGPAAEPMHFNAVFQPSLQQYSIQGARAASGTDHHG